MSTVAHVLASCGALRTSWRWLSTSTVPGRIRRNQRALSESAKAKRNEQAVQDRGDRPHLVNQIRIVGGGQPPTNVGVLDVRSRIAVEVDQLAAELSLAVGTLSVGLIPVRVHNTDNTSTDRKFTSALDWISSRAHLLTDQHLIDNAHRRLTGVDGIARTFLGEGPDRRRMSALCPACGRRSLAWDCSSDRREEWHVLCTTDACRCRGVDCACKIPDRQHGMRHVWLAGAWNHLALQLKEA